MFVDADRNKVTAECEITNRNGYPGFTMSGEYAGLMGQCFDSVKPANEYQAKLIQIWREWHLNGMNAGTEEQSAHVKGLSYQDAKDKLQELGLLTVMHKGERYTYGSGWICKDLPEDFEDNLNELLDNIGEIEEQNSDRLIEDTEEDAELFQDFSNPITAHGLALICGLSVNEVEDIVENSDTYWTVQGVDYIAGTDDEMDDAWDVELDNYLEECVYPDLPENMRIYFDDDKWKDDARVDGRGHALNRYDDGEEYTQVQGVGIYAYRQ